MITDQQSSFVQAPAVRTDIAPHRRQNTWHTCPYLSCLSLTCHTCHSCTWQVMESPAFETDVAPRRRQNTWATLDPEYGNWGRISQRDNIDRQNNLTWKEFVSFRTLSHLERANWRFCSILVLNWLGTHIPRCQMEWHSCGIILSKSKVLTTIIWSCSPYSETPFG